MMPSTVATRRATACLSEITMIASTLRDEYPWAVQEFEGLHEGQAAEAASFFDRVRTAVAMMGWLADMGAQQLGEPAARGDATQWLMSPCGAEAMQQGGGAAARREGRSS